VKENRNRSELKDKQESGRIRKGRKRKKKRRMTKVREG
jgi:hypothetical protein